MWRKCNLCGMFVANDGRRGLKGYGERQSMELHSFSEL